MFRQNVVDTVKSLKQITSDLIFGAYSLYEIRRHHKLSQVKTNLMFILGKPCSFSEFVALLSADQNLRCSQLCTNGVCKKMCSVVFNHQHAHWAHESTAQVELKEKLTFANLVCNKPANVSKPHLHNFGRLKVDRFLRGPHWRPLVIWRSPLVT